MRERRSISIIGLNGSPHRRGNTATLMRWVLEGCEAAGATTTWLHVIDHDVRYCEGCFGCLQTGTCLLDDDFAAVLERLCAADGIVVGSPVYAGAPSAQLKTLLDRITLLNLYAGVFTTQCTVGAATSGVAPTRDVAKELATFFGRRVGIIGAKTSTVAKGYQPLIEHHPARLPVRANRLGERLVQSIRRQKDRQPLPTFTDLWINLLRWLILKPMVQKNPEQFSGILRIWKERATTSKKDLAKRGLRNQKE